MDLGLDESKLLYGLGAFLGVAAILYFGQQLILDLSPVVKSFILLSGTVAFLGAAEYVSPGTVRSAFYVFSAFSYLSFLVYLFTTFKLGSGGVFLVLAFSSGVFIALGYLRGEKEYGLERETARRVVAAVAVLVAAAVLFDVAGAQPEYTLELRESVEVREGEEFTIGTLEIRNDFPLRRNVNPPTLGGCVSTVEGAPRRGIYMSPDLDTVPGSSVETIMLNESVRSRPDTNNSISGTYTVVRGTCPDDPEPRTVYVEEDGEGSLRVVGTAE